MCFLLWCRCVLLRKLFVFVCVLWIRNTLYIILKKKRKSNLVHFHALTVVRETLRQHSEKVLKRTETHSMQLKINLFLTSWRGFSLTTTMFLSSAVKFHLKACFICLFLFISVSIDTTISSGWQWDRIWFVNVWVSVCTCVICKCVKESENMQLNWN